MPRPRAGLAYEMQQMLEPTLESVLRSAVILSPRRTAVDWRPTVPDMAMLYTVLNLPFVPMHLSLTAGP